MYMYTTYMYMYIIHVHVLHVYTCTCKSRSPLNNALSSLVYHTNLCFLPFKCLASCTHTLQKVFRPTTCELKDCTVQNEDVIQY